MTAPLAEPYLSPEATHFYLQLSPDDRARLLGEAEAQAAESLRLDPSRDFRRERDAWVEQRLAARGARPPAGSTMPDPGLAMLNQAIASGARLVVYQYCISVVFMTFKRNSGVKLIPPGSSGFLPGLPYTLLSAVAGWWGIPWGPIYTIQSVWRNSGGGIDVTNVFRARMQN